MNGTLKNKHETDVNESIIQALMFKGEQRLHSRLI
jgi:hypothetical protein